MSFQPFRISTRGKIVQIVGFQSIHPHVRCLALTVADLDELKVRRAYEASLPRGKVGAVRDPMAFPKHSWGHKKTIDIMPRGGVAAFGVEFRGELFISVKVENPGVTKRDFALGVVALSRESVEWAAEYARAHGAGDFDRAVSRTGIEHDDVVTSLY
jgi:hypothetical protein